jgi:UPF0716 protein FxsA
VGTGLLGAALARHEGARVLRSWQESMARMQVPEEGVLSGALVLLGAVLLITPGVLTDVAGLTLLFPPTRRLFAARLRHWAERRLQIHTVHAFSAGAGEVGSVSPGAVIDVEAEDARGAESS